MRLKLFTVLGILILTSCSGVKDIFEEMPPMETEFVEWETVGKGILYGGGEEGIEESSYLIKNEEQWKLIKQKMDSSNPVSSNFSIKEINFEESMIIACFDQVRPNGAYSMKIVEVQENETTILLTIEKEKSTMDAISILVQPYHIIQVPISDKEIGYIVNN